ncbi:iron-sulfur cluster-binding domain-containing protein [Paraburkholderia dipogonis]|uniref:Iron-sulfur cluster-binding domain-containing protein n=1 Tax=Paraburkholderia dipogonis TaxID=1211383 RepID=A0A4Y8MJD9_9BURK|nr:iron-sulfur cluster-binding domain-containing protein [Paraburkholderia dipogonis]TFE37504.1 iron-sulfur cluster-binding domain-containing protein [Paraburkholderia dipogonis]
MSGSAFTEATCTRITSENWNVKTFQFSLARPHDPFSFTAGQYVTLGFEIAGEKAYRCYTVSSAPQCPQEEQFEITVKHSPGGTVSTWLHENITVGATIEVSHPTGDFTLPKQESEALLFVAGGVGITPLISMARAIRARRLSSDIQFLQFARTPSDILFRNELLEIARSSPGITPHFFTSIGDNAVVTKGRLCRDLLDRAVPDWTSRRVFCCGPESFMAAMRLSFLETGARPERFHQESFELPEQAPVHVPPCVGVTRVRLSESGLDVKCDPGTTILDAVHALPNGPRIPNACRSGVCGTCKLRKLDGSVEMHHNGGITDEEIEDGFVLTCCSIPLSDVTVEY